MNVIQGTAFTSVQVIEILAKRDKAGEKNHNHFVLQIIIFKVHFNIFQSY